jgi:hypothetical protein
MTWGNGPPVLQATLRPETLRLISQDPDLTEQYRQATVNHQVADLLDVRAQSAETAEQAAIWRRRATERRELGDRLVQQLLDRLSAARRAESPGAVSTPR